jgi:hypothetical protein
LGPYGHKGFSTIIEKGGCLVLCELRPLTRKVIDQAVKKSKIKHRYLTPYKNEVR